MYDVVVFLLLLFGVVVTAGLYRTNRIAAVLLGLVVWFLAMLVASATPFSPVIAWTYRAEFLLYGGFMGIATRCKAGYIIGGIGMVLGVISDIVVLTLVVRGW